jgi:hypothetical protein
VLNQPNSRENGDVLSANELICTAICTSTAELLQLAQTLRARLSDSELNQLVGMLSALAQARPGQII